MALGVLALAILLCSSSSSSWPAKQIFFLFVMADQINIFHQMRPDFCDILQVFYSMGTDREKLHRLGPFGWVPRRQNAVSEMLCCK
jgi:hypothetical protein